MKYSGSITINKPKEIVTQFFADPNYLHEYQDGFIRKELVSGTKGEKGSTSKMYYKYGKHDMVLTETIVSNNLPDSFEAFYHHKHMDNTWKCKFIYMGINKTRYEYEFEYVRMSFFPKLLSFLMPGMYRRQGEKWLRQFKEFVEKQ